jgi:pyridoxal 5'-phosphate synthase glutaminase subunit Pdx2
MKIGVLAVQGAFIEHEHIIEKIGHEIVEIRQKKDLEGIDGIILPGGESTVQGQLLRKLDMLDTIKSAIADGLPTLATCAGLILLAGHIDNDNSIHIGTLPVTVKRNAYGRQLGSFVRTAARTSTLSLTDEMYGARINVIGNSSKKWIRVLSLKSRRYPPSAPNIRLNIVMSLSFNFINIRS